MTNGSTGTPRCGLSLPPAATFPFARPIYMGGTMITSATPPPPKKIIPPQLTQTSPKYAHDLSCLRVLVLGWEGKRLRNTSLLQGGTKHQQENTQLRIRRRHSHHLPNSLVGESSSMINRRHAFEEGDKIMKCAFSLTKTLISKEYRGRIR